MKSYIAIIFVAFTILFVSYLVGTTVLGVMMDKLPNERNSSYINEVLLGDNNLNGHIFS
jgi:hypothetical protein